MSPEDEQMQKDVSIEMFDSVPGSIAGIAIQSVEASMNGVAEWIGNK
jgi:hypothetical protein